MAPAGIARELTPEIAGLVSTAPNLRPSEVDFADLTSGSVIAASHSSITACNTTNIVLMSQARSAPRAAMSDPPPRIRVVNPNSNEDVTRGLDAALALLRVPKGAEIVSSTLEQVQCGVETEGDVESVVM